MRTFSKPSSTLKCAKDRSTTLGCHPVPTCRSGCDRTPDYRSGSLGCDICSCPTTCESRPISCPSDEICELQSIECEPWEYPCGPLLAVCVPIPETTTETTTEIVTTIECQSTTCLLHCRYVTESNGCGSCYCPSTCEGFDCPEGEECIVVEGGVSFPQCVLRNETSTPPTPAPTTSKTCPHYTCPKSHCQWLEPGPDGCPQCGCIEPPCWFNPCGSDEECVETDDPPYYNCTAKIEPSTPPPTTSTYPLTTATSCPTTTCPKSHCDWVDHPGPDGCPICACYEPPCWFQPCGPDKECHEIDDPPYYYCTLKLDASTTMATPTTTFECPLPPCARGCRLVPQPDGCFGCSCPSSTCEETTCEPGQECVMQNDDCSDESSCFLWPTCVSTAAPTSTVTTTFFPCPPGRPCREGCQRYNDDHGCHACYCPTSCEYIQCNNNEVCELRQTSCYFFDDPCLPVAVCVPADTTTPCPLIKCAPYCLPDTGPDGCPSCNCPPSCQTVKCSAGYECQLVNGTCDVDVDPCFPQPQCVPTDPCMGSPNRGICGRATYRWTYNSVTDRCKKFLYYGCTPSPNTFSTRKACKNRCKPICAAVFCEPDCYTLTRKNKCPKCICPNPCKGIRCRSGFECKMRERKCHAEPEPFCARIGPILSAVEGTM